MIDGLVFIRLEHLSVFELAKHVSILSSVHHCASHISKPEFYKKVQVISDEQREDDYEVIIEEIDFDTLLDDDPDKILYCGEETNCGIWYNSVQELIESTLVMKLSGVYL